MRRSFTLALASLAALGGCREDWVRPSAPGLLLQVVAYDGATLRADEVRIRLDGPSTVERTAQPGETVTFSALEPGSYDLAIEGRLGGYVEWYDEFSLTITAGSTTTRTAVARPFVPAVTPLQVDVEVGVTVTLAWEPVEGARDYLVEIADEPGFSNPTEDLTGGATGFEFVADTPGARYVRVRAVNGLGSRSLPSQAINVSAELRVLEPDELCSDYTDFAVPTFEDANVEAAVREALSVEGQEPLTCGLLGTLTSLTADDAGITSLVGTQNLTGATYIKLFSNSITDLNPLSDLTGLMSLFLNDNQISDIEPLRGLTSLTDLSVGGNDISDLAPLRELEELVHLLVDGNDISDVRPLSGLTSLTELFLVANAVSDVSPLAGLTALTHLTLTGNPLDGIGSLGRLTSLDELRLSRTGTTDLGPLSTLTKLNVLELAENGIADIGPLATLTGLTTLSLQGNAIVDIGPLANLTGLTTLSLQGNDIVDVDPLSGLTNLRFLYLYGNSISDIGPLGDLTSLDELRLDGNHDLTDIQPLLDNPGLGSGDQVDLRATAVDCKDVAKLRAREVTVVSDCEGAVVLDPSDSCNEFPDDANATFEDTNLEAAVREALSVEGQEPLTCGLLGTLTSLTADDAGITSLVGTQNLTGIEMIKLYENSVSDLGPLGTLESLRWLGLNRNDVSSLEPLSDLAGLTFLSLGANEISDLAPLSGLKDLGYLLVDENHISDVGPLSGLTSLTELFLVANVVSDVDSLAGLTSLTILRLSRNSINDVSPLSGLTSLDELRLDGNPDLSDIQPLLDNPGLGPGDTVNLSGTNVSCADVAALEAKGVTVVSDCDDD